MEWIVKNAVNRDVERQHLNKILQDIKRSLADGQVKVTQQINTVTQRQQGSSTGSGSSSTPRNIRVVLNGDVSGSGDGTSVITIPVTVDEKFVQEAPNDGSPYWRVYKEWLPVPTAITALSLMDDSGLVVYDSDAQEWTAREIIADPDWIDVTDGDGLEGNPTLTLNEKVKSGFARIVTLAATTIHGGRAVVVEDGESRHPTLTDVGDSVKIAGMAMNSAMLGEEVEVQTGGVTNDNSWTWVAGPVFVDEDGVLVQPAPVTGYVVSIGRATDSTTIDIDVGTPLIRS